MPAGAQGSALAAVHSPPLGSKRLPLGRPSGSWTRTTGTPRATCWARQSCQPRPPAVTVPRLARPLGAPVVRRCARAATTRTRAHEAAAQRSAARTSSAPWETIHVECGHAVARQVHVVGWDRWHLGCPARCGHRGSRVLDRPASPPPCPGCGAALDVVREEALLDLEVRSARQPRTLLDVTVRHAVPGDAARLAAAASRGGAVNAEAEGDKRRRYPSGRTPWRLVPLAHDTYGRHGATP